LFSYTHHGPWQLEAYNVTNMRWINEKKCQCHQLHVMRWNKHQLLQISVQD
ncbi:hypothetical protein CAPTEDRAFT_126243, partial [Capitella teleta]